MVFYLVFRIFQSHKMEGLLSRSCCIRVITVGLIVLISITSCSSDCADKTVGVENKYIIPDSSFTATSYYNKYLPSNGRLGAEIGWAPRTNGQDDYLQIDLGLPYVICALATQGSSTGVEWVTQYKISLSMDNITWTPYQENGALKLFVGNTDFSTVKKNTLTQPLTRYIRFIPTAYKSWKTMRVGIYGYIKACEDVALGMESGAIKDGSITASTTQHPAKNARLHYTSGSSWCASTSDSDPYLQIDLGTSHLICAVATQGNSQTDQWVKTYQINTSTDGTTWTTYQENNTDRIFYGNYDRSTVVRRLPYQHAIVTRYLRFVPKTFNTRAPCLRTEIYGYPFQTSCSSQSVGIPSTSLVPNHRFTATSHFIGYEPFKGRLGGSKAWVPITRNNVNDYHQVDLGAMFHICSVATQGAGETSENEWVKKYELSYSTNNVQWTTYCRTPGVNHEFSGNTNRDTVVTNALTKPFKARFLRVRPTQYESSKMLRVDFKGLSSVCTASLGLENSQIPDSNITSSSYWRTYTPSSGRLYGNSSWCSATMANTEFIQVDLGQAKTVTGIATQGGLAVNARVTSYKVSFSFDNTTWNDYKEGHVVKNLEGNTNTSDVRVNWLRHPIGARYIRITPQTHENRNCLRFDLYGCDVFVIPKVLLDTADFILPSIKGSSRTLTCSVLGEPTPDIQWFDNGIKINGATQSTLKVQFISAEDVMSKYNCTREDRAVVCNTFYTCRATYPSYVPGGGMDEASVKVTIFLNMFQTTYSNSTIWSLEGNEVTVGCFTIGEEPVHYSWRKVGSLLLDSSVTSASGDDLIIRLKSYRDFGTYVCNASNSNKTVVYRIHRVELKKYVTRISDPCKRSESTAKKVMPYVVPLSFIILVLVICIAYLVYRLRRQGKQYNKKNMIDKTDEKGNANDAMDNADYPSNVTNNRSLKTETAKSDEIQTSGYMELLPRRISDTLYQSIQEPANRHGDSSAISQAQGKMGNEQYMNLN